MTDMVYLFEEDDEKIQMFFDEFDDGQREDNFSAVREDRKKAYFYPYHLENARCLSGSGQLF